jgi:hypothetical protein
MAPIGGLSSGKYPITLLLAASFMFSSFKTMKNIVAGCQQAKK